jgi:hypothetical protein
MLQYGGYTWLLDVRDSPIQARIGPSCLSADEVHWQVDLQYIAAGRAWRRVKSWLRPTLRFCVYGFCPGATGWEDLEGQCFNSDDDNCGSAGTLFVETTHWKTPGTELSFGPHRLQFVKRRGFWFTTELVALPTGAQRTPTRTRVAALANGNSDEPLEVPIGEAHDQSGIYLVEDLAFGLVEVAAPVNARDPQRFAHAKAESLTGIKSVADCDVGPRLAPDGKDWRPIAGDDWRVRLHHGSRWTHFTL